MNKTIKYALNFALIGGAALAVRNVFKQYQNPKPDFKFDWNKFFKEFGKGAL